MARLLCLIAMLLLAAACQSLKARPLVDVAIVDRDTGQWLPEYAYRGRRYVPGEPGHRYAIRLTNRTDARVLVVLSVDGVNAVTGETAAPSQAGYVLAPWESAEINGWRKSLEDVAQFYFTELPDSYAARTNRPNNVGVIGIAVFQERRDLERGSIDVPPWSPPLATIEESQGAMRESGTATAASTPDAASAVESMRDSMRDQANGAAKQSVGTGHGAREWAPTQRTHFQRSSMRPSQFEELRYEAPAALVAMGVLREDYMGRRARNAEPRAFPGGFVPDPRW